MRVFLLSPANASGVRMRLLTRPEADFELAVRLRRGSATLGEAFAFTSGLYFRGKRAYARAFARPPAGRSGALVIAPGLGLMPEDTPITTAGILAMGRVPVDLAHAPYREPFERAARELHEAMPAQAEVVLLGSIATPSYVEPLLAVFGRRLLFPESFVGRGDMSRGGLLLRCVREGTELSYVPVDGAVVRGPRPPKLPPPPR